MGNQIGCLNDRDPNDAPASPLTGTEKSKLKLKEYEKSLRELQTELCFLQDWVRKTRPVVVKVRQAPRGKTKK